MQDRKDTKKQKPRMFRVVETLVNNKTAKLIVPCKKNTEEDFLQTEGLKVFVFLNPQIRKALCMLTRQSKLVGRILNISFTTIPEYVIEFDSTPDEPFMFTEVDISVFPSGAMFQEWHEVAVVKPDEVVKQETKKKETALGVRKTEGPFFVGGNGEGPTKIDAIKKAAQDYYDDLT